MIRPGLVDNPRMALPPIVASTRPAGPLRWGRIFTVAAAWVAVVIVGRTVTPTQSRADSPRFSQPEGAVVGTLVGRDYLVRINATERGPRYTVTTLSGQVLQTNLDSREMAKAFPGLDPANLQAAPGGLMQADTGERSRD